MVAPVTGPFTRSTTVKGPLNQGGFGPDWLRKNQTWYRQKPPYTLPLTYSMDMRVILRSANSWDYSQAASAIELEHLSGLDDVRVYNKALASLQNEVRGINAQLGATLGEYKSSLGMISARATQLWKGFLAAKRGDVSGLRRLWGQHAGIRRRLRAAGGHVLEYSFGWAPLVSDLQSAVAATQQGLPPFRVRKTSSSKLRKDQRFGGSPSRVDTTYTLISWTVRARVDVVNSNLLHANQLGLTNLASVIWELTPNSYILDYFVNVSDYLAQFTFADGLALSETSRTLMKKTDFTSSSWWPSGTAPWPAPSWEGQHVSVTRSPGLPPITLGFRPPWDVSLSRASTSIARLLQQLKGK